jgi:DNA-binding transcriptional MocR family regulator
MTVPSDPALPGLNRGGSTPLYLQLGALLRDKIKRGEWRPDQKIPSENELNRMYGISRITTRQVLEVLVHEQLLFRVPGKGTFVAPERSAPGPWSPPTCRWRCSRPPVTSGPTTLCGRWRPTGRSV